jgi:tripartite-type tricarboxylate transporter receptor subunit TctC
MKGPGKPAKFAHPGAGSMAHLQTVLLTKALDVEVSLVGYRGGGQAMADVIGGHADLVFNAPTTSAELIQAGKIQGYAFAGPKRYQPLKDIPTLEEAGYKGLDIQLWQGLFAPAGTPRPIIDKLNTALRKALSDDSVKATYVRNGVEAFPDAQLTPEFASELLASEVKRWASAISEADIKAGN